MSNFNSTLTSSGILQNYGKRAKKGPSQRLYKFKKLGATRHFEYTSIKSGRTIRSATNWEFKEAIEIKKLSTK